MGSARLFQAYAWCAIDTPKEASLLYDQQSRDACLAHLELATNGSANTSGTAGTAGGEGGAANRPFFVGCGFHKPHAPHHAPKEFFDMLPDYPDIPLPSNPANLFAPAGMPEVAWHPYADVSGMVEDPVFNGTVNLTRLRMYRRGCKDLGTLFSDRPNPRASYSPVPTRAPLFFFLSFLFFSFPDLHTCAPLRRPSTPAHWLTHALVLPCGRLRPLADYAAIAYQDYNIGQIVDKLEAVGHRDDTVVIVFGDHVRQLRHRLGIPLASRAFLISAVLLFYPETPHS